MWGWGRSSVKPTRSEDLPAPRVETQEPQPLSEGASALDQQFKAIETLVGRIYAAHGLPSQPGHYRRSQDEDDWALISQSLSPSEKFDLILNAPGEARAHYAAYDHLGANHEARLVRLAAALAAAASGLKHLVESGTAASHQVVADAIELGAFYQTLSSALPDEDAP